jgi:hypothetical protein
MDNTTHSLREKLKLRQLAAKQQLADNHPHATLFFQERGLDLGKIRQHSARLLTAGALGGTLLLSTPPAYAQDKESLVLPAPLAQVLIEAGKVLPAPPQEYLVGRLREILPPITNSQALPYLTHQEEKIIGRLIEQTTGVPARASLEGEHLNTVYGYVGYEQHLKRFPGDTLDKHDEFPEAGIAASLGGFGYFTEDDGRLTKEGILREKYYMAVQLMYLPDWDRRWRYLVPWYKWRKMIMVNVENGKAVVGVIGDAGPAAWTGKHFGASPEVMNALGGPKYRKGRVLLYFVDDPENKIPLGPVDYNKVEIQLVKAL